MAFDPTPATQGDPLFECFSPNGRYIAAGLSSDGINLWRTSDGLRETGLVEGEDVTQFAFTTDGRRLAYIPRGAQYVQFVDCEIRIAHSNTPPIH